MNTSRLKKVLKLKSTLTTLLALFLYTIFFFLFLKPPSYTLSNIEASCTFTSCDQNDPVRSSLEQIILDAKESVTLIIYSICDSRIIQALKTAANNGVQVTVIYDPSETKDGSSILGPHITSISYKPKGLMHNKLLVIDHSYVWMGSANLSSKSLTSQGNLIMTIDCKSLAARIEDLAGHLILKKRYTQVPLFLTFKDQNTTVFFHPYHGDQSLKKLIESINAARKRIFVAMFTFTHREIASSLVLARSRGVDVRVVFDKESCKQTSKKIFRFFKNHKIRCGYRKKPGLLHYKTALIDDNLITGSCNWTRAAFSDNCETIVFIEPLSPQQKAWVQRWWEIVESTSTLE